MQNNTRRTTQGLKTASEIQLLDALLRKYRYIIGIEMRTGKRSFQQGVTFFVKEGYMSRGYATRETKRGTSDPTYLVYTLGKLEF